MNPETAIDKVLQEMLDLGLTRKEYTETVRYYLNLAHSIGFNYGTRYRLRSKVVNKYSKDGKYLETFVSASDAGRKTGIKITNICSVCRKIRKTAGGFKWKYAK